MMATKKMGTSRAPSAASVPSIPYYDDEKDVDKVLFGLPGFFKDPETGERLRDDEREDVHGTPLIGENEFGIWWGTDRAAWVLSRSRRACVQIVVGHLGAIPWDGVFIGTEAEAIEYAETHCIRIAGVLSEPLQRRVARGTFT